MHWGSLLVVILPDFQYSIPKLHYAKPKLRKVLLGAHITQDFKLGVPEVQLLSSVTTPGTVYSIGATRSHNFGIQS